MKRMFCALILCMSTVLSVSAYADNSAPEVPVPAAVGSEIQPRAEETKWYNRIHNGNIEKRLWSITYSKWLTDWIIVGPVNP